MRLLVKAHTNMEKNIAVTLFLLMAYRSVRVMACPDVCTCLENTVDCTQQRLSSIPLSIPVDAVTLDLRYNAIETLSATALSMLANVKYLYLDSAGLSAIEIGSFDSLSVIEEISLSSNKLGFLPDSLFSRTGSTLTKLDLKGNGLGKITPATFEGLTQLSVLDISSNNLSIIPNDGFVHLSSLMSLDISNNGLTSLSLNAFNGLERLPLLRLDHNNISTMQSGSLTFMKSLKTFSAVGNSFTTIPIGLFSNHNVLTEINLQDNKIGDLSSDMFSELPSIRVIKLRSNQISSVGHSATHAFINIKSSVQTIDLSKNQLTHIHRYHFISLTSLQSIDLSENQIISVDDGFFTCNSLAIVNLEHNRITSIEPRVFGVQSLVTVDLSYNQMTLVPTDAFESFNSDALVENIYLNDNDITTIHNNAFEFCTNVRVIVLKRNKISNLDPSAFSSLNNLREIDLSSNFITMISVNTFKNLIHLESINLMQNNLELVLTGAFFDLRQLKEIDLSFNAIHTIEAEAFDSLPVLETLNLAGNRLAEVPKSGIKTLTSITTLDLSSNFINAITESKAFGDLKDLESLWLQSNGITSIAEDCFGGLPSLRNLTLHENEVSHLSAALSSSDHLLQLVYLSLKSNSISKIDIATFKGLSALRILDLSFNKLTSLPNGTFDDSRATLSDLRLQNNSWNCDCELDWIVAHFANIISGGVCTTPVELFLRPLFGYDAVTSLEICPVTTAVITSSVSTTTIEPAFILTPDHEIAVKENSLVKLPCISIGNPAPIVSWKNPNGSLITSTGIFNLDVLSGTLIIDGITNIMEGYYICTASNTIGDHASVHIRVWVLFPPNIINFVDSVMVSDHLQSYTLPCDVRAFPNPTFHWTIPDTSKVDTSNTGSVIMTSSGTLHVYAPDKSSTGYYNCTATNSEGSVWREAFVFVYNGTENSSPVIIASREGSSVVLPVQNLYSETGFLWLLPSGAYIVSSVHIRSAESDLERFPMEDLSTVDGTGGGYSTVLDQENEGIVETEIGTHSTASTANANTETSPIHPFTIESYITSTSSAISTAYSMHGKLQLENFNLSSVYSVNSLTGALIIKLVSGSANATAAGPTTGSYRFFSAFGAASYDLKIDDDYRGTMTIGPITLQATINSSTFSVRVSSLITMKYLVLSCILIVVISAIIAFFVFLVTKPRLQSTKSI